MQATDVVSVETGTSRVNGQLGGERAVQVRVEMDRSGLVCRAWIRFGLDDSWSAVKCTGLSEYTGMREMSAWLKRRGFKGRGRWGHGMRVFVRD